MILWRIFQREFHIGLQEFHLLSIAKEVLRAALKRVSEGRSLGAEAGHGGRGQFVVVIEPVKDFGLVWGYKEPIKVLRYHIAQTGAVHTNFVLLKLSYAIEPLGHIVSTQIDSVSGA